MTPFAVNLPKMSRKACICLRGRHGFAWLLLAAVSLPAPTAAAKTARLESLPGDGQVSLVAASFDAARLRLYGYEWSDWSRVLLPFDGAALPHISAASLKSAKLRLRVASVVNGDGKALEVYRITVPWGTDATWSASGGGQNWPRDHNGNANIDFAGGVGTAPAAATVVTAAGEIELDVTEVVRDWLDGEPVHGLLLRVGPTIWGSPGGTGNWNIELLSAEAGEGRPALEVTWHDVLADGSVSRVAAPSFDAARLRLYGYEWRDWSRVLIRFDLTNLPHLRPDSVQSARLRLKAVAVDNGGSLPVEVAQVTVPWGTDAAWFGANWPANGNGDRNIDHAGGVGAAPVSSIVIKEPGDVLVDITAMVRSWMAGTPNHGLILRAGPAIWGIPGGTGNWNFEFLASEAGDEGPALEITTSSSIERAGAGLQVNWTPGTLLESSTDLTRWSPVPGAVPPMAFAPSERARFFRTVMGPPGAVFPRKPYRAWFQPPFLDSHPDLYRHMNLHTSGGHESVAVFRALNARGVAVLTWAYGPNSPWAQAGAAYFRDQCMPRYFGRQMTVGVGIDEWNTGFPVVGQQGPMAAEGYRLARALWPDQFIACWVTGPDATFIGLMQDGTFDLALVQGQTHVPDAPPGQGWTISWEGIAQRCQALRAAGVLDRTIVALGYLSATPDKYGHFMTKEALRDLVGRCKSGFPEMPGVAFYGYADDTPATRELIRYADELSAEFYPEPGVP